MIDEHPQAIHHPSKDAFQCDHDRDRVASITEVEQLIRATCLRAPDRQLLQEVKKTIQYQINKERKDIFSILFPERPMEKTDDMWLRGEIDEAYQKQRRALSDFEEKYQNRMGWYEFIEGDIERMVRVAKTELLPDGDTFVVRTLVDKPHPDTEPHEISLSLVNGYSGPDLAEFGYTTPLNTIIYRSEKRGEKDNVYPLLPWYGTTICKGPYKHTDNRHTLCKHEIAALLQKKQGQFPEENRYNLDLDPRATRLVSLEAQKEYVQNIEGKPMPSGTFESSKSRDVHELKSYLEKDNNE